MASNFPVVWSTAGSRKESSVETLQSEMNSVNSKHNQWLSRNAPRLPWNKFFRGEIFNPKPGEHIGIIGPTGQGKTALQNAIVPAFPFVVVFATKPADDTMDKLIEQENYLKMSNWGLLGANGLRLNPIDTPRRVLWPDATELDSVDKQKKVFTHALASIFREGGRPKKKPVGWAVAIDELWYFSNMLKMDLEIKLYLMQGRSLGVTLIAATQRPAWVPVEMYSQSTHLFFFRDTDDRNLSRIGEMSHSEKSMIRRTVANLEQHQVLYVNTRTGKMARTRGPVPREG